MSWIDALLDLLGQHERAPARRSSGGLFTAQGQAAGITRTITWEEYEDGTVRALEYMEWDDAARGGFTAPAGSNYLWGLAAQRGYVDIWSMPHEIGWMGAPFPNVTALLTALGIPADAERHPMRRGGMSLSP